MNWTRKGGKIQKWKSAAQQWMSRIDAENKKITTQSTKQPKIATL
jgi:hypothetical protein